MLLSLLASAQGKNDGRYWNAGIPLQSYRIPPAPLGYQPEFLDLNGDGKQDAVKTVTRDDIPVLWLDDDNNMKAGDTEGDLVNDCLLVDRTKDGIYDLIVKYADIDDDGRADVQLICDYPDGFTKNPLVEGGHYMWVFDDDHDGVFNYIDWDTMSLQCWEKNGISDFYTDYSGNSMFIKAHRNTLHFKDLRLNWENPFLFYDYDNDGLSEMAVRICDWTKADSAASREGYNATQYHGDVTWFSMGIDLDNDNCESNDFDFDMTVRLIANPKDEGTVGFNYMDQVHPLKHMRGLPEADKFFPDPRIRQLTELIYPGRNEVMDLTWNGKWDTAWFTFDEDDDCGRWERVELYDPMDIGKIGTRKGGLDNNSQADVSGDRGEWDKDNSGHGNLYVARFDGRIHLNGAEWGAWRIDHNTQYYQGFDKGFQRTAPQSWSTIAYKDTDDNGFIDTILYDLDGDSEYEETISLKELGIYDVCEVINITKMDYKKYRELYDKVCNDIWKGAGLARKAALACGVNPDWYAKMHSHMTPAMRYSQGYWYQYYIYKDIEYKYLNENNPEMVKAVRKAYFGGDWESFIKSVPIAPGKTSIKVMSYNIRYGSAHDGDNSWKIRRIATPAMLDDQAPVAFGVQEALDFQIAYILKKCPRYKCVGVGREDGKSSGEHMSVFYDTSRIELLDWGTYWLSETPDVPSIGWDAQCHRTATWTKMRLKDTKEVFFFVNTHLDHVGSEARRNGLALIVNNIGKMNPEGFPMILTGDMNMTPGNECFTDLYKIMKSARTEAEDSDDTPSATGFKKPSSIIDYVFYSGFDRCTDFKVVSKSYENIPFISDHYPVTATLVF